MVDLKTGLVTLQLTDIDVSSTETVTKAITALLPAIAENVLVASSGDRARGCSVSGTVTSGGGASGTITCTF